MASRTSAILGSKYIVNDYFTLVLQAWAFYLIKNYSRCEVQCQKVCIMPVVWDSALCSADKYTKWMHLSPWLVLHCYTHYNVENSIICKFIGVQGAFECGLLCHISWVQRTISVYFWQALFKWKPKMYKIVFKKVLCIFSYCNWNMAVGHWVNRAETKGLMGTRLIARRASEWQGFRRYTSCIN